MQFLWVVSFVFLLSALVWHVDGVFQEVGFDFRASESQVAYKYDRINEVKRQCGSVLKSASDLKPEDSRIYSIKEEMYFVNGDWKQDLGDAPILPFDDRDVRSDLSKDPLKLFSFWVVDVDRSHRSKKSVFVSGLVSMGITFDGMFTEKPYEGSRQFDLWPGHTRLSVSFQGVYTESVENGGERVLCLLGTTMLPSREPDNGDPWKWVEDSHLNYNQPPLSEDDQILLVLRFPMVFTLTNRVIQGTMKSLNSKSNSKYFEEVRIFSQLGKTVHYEFDSDKRIISRSCEPYPYQDSLLKDGIQAYKGVDFCRILEEATRGQAFSVVPNWRCNGTDDFCSKLGPFGTERDIRATDGGFKGVKLYMQNINCENGSGKENSTSSRVAAVFRAVGPSENQYTASGRSGPSNMTLAGEGFWQSSSGQLCMIGCLGMVNDSEGKECDSRICLYIPTLFSIRQRSIVIGSFSSIHNDSSTNFFSNYSDIFLEGLYDPHVGTMYLVGCRDIRASWKVLSESMDLEVGLDCLIDVIVSYPPTTARWLVNPTAKISIASQRTEDDPLYFKPLKLQTLPIMYRQQREDILSRQGMEGILRILTLSLGVAFILSQLVYIQQNMDPVPYMSLVMLGVQAVGYTLPLITGAEAVFKRMSPSESAGVSSYNLERTHWFRVIDYTVKVLVMICLLLTLRLCQKVWKSRLRILSQAPHEPQRVPSDKQVVIATLIIHIAGYGSVLIAHALKSHGTSLQTEAYLDPSMNNRVWETKLEEYVGLVHDFFLLPQVIGNFIWQIDSKPLRKLYFVGVTVVRLLPHMYDYIRAPRTNPYISVEYEFVNPNLDFFSKFGDLAIPATAIFLAVAVYVQQRWGYEKVRETFKLGKFKILPAKSRNYQRLPSKVSEAELVSGANRNGTREDEHDDDE